MLGETKKDKHGQACYYQMRHFSYFFLSVDGMMVKEALVVLATLIRLMAVKIGEHILHIKGRVKGLISIAVTGYFYRALCRYRDRSAL